MNTMKITLNYDACPRVADMILLTTEYVEALPIHREHCGKLIVTPEEYSCRLHFTPYEPEELMWLYALTRAEAEAVLAFAVECFNHTCNWCE